MKTTPWFKLPTLGALLLTPLFGQMASPTGVADYSAGLLGRTYTAGEFGYVHHVQRAPDVLRRYGFASNAPLRELGSNTDATFRYDYTRGSGTATLVRHDVAVAFTRYATLHDGTKPFLVAQAGWAGLKTAGELHSSFAYLVGAGAELTLRPRLALTPYLNFREALEHDDRAWNFGAKLGWRFEQRWSGTFAVQIDDHHNIEYAVGLQRRF